MLQNTTLYLSLGAALAAYAFASFFVFPFFTSQARYLRQQPWVGVKKQFFARFRAGMASIFHTDEMIKEGYKKYSLNNKAFVLPQFVRDPIVVIPGDSVHEFLAKPDEQVDHKTIGKESIFHDFLFGHEFDGDEHFQVVRRQLTRKLPLLTTDVYHELVEAIRTQWPVKNEWTTVHPYPTCMKIVSQAANRVFAGKDLCRNPEFLEHSRLYAQSVFQTGAITMLIPKFLHPVVAPFLTRDVKKHLRICSKLAAPVITDRLQRMRSEGKNYKPANDVLQWILDEAIEGANPRYLELDFICRQLLLLNMVAIHTTSMVMTNTLLDLAAAHNREEVIVGLRDEVERVLAENNNEWTKDAVNDLLRVDSAIRETMRYSSLGELAMPRIVQDPNGITLSNGIHLPQGIRVASPAQAIHTDERYYPDPLKYDAFRFSAPREAFNLTEEAKISGDKARLDKVLELKNRGLIVTTDDFLSFGAQRHACPGRFFASQEMKLMLAYVVMNYDFKVDGERPKNFHINGVFVPTDDATMQMRLRAH